MHATSTHLTIGFDDDEAMDRFRFLAVVGLVLLNGADLFLTRTMLERGAIEANPLMAAIIAGPVGVLVKLGVPIVVGWRHLVGPLRRPLVIGLGFVCVLYLGVVTWNYHLYMSRFG